MGSACCVAARDRTITNGTSSDVIPRNVRYSPSWSVRWDNRRRVAGEEASMTWYSDANGTNDRLDNKSQTTVATNYTSEEGSPLESFRNVTWQKSSPHVPQNPTTKSPTLSISEEGGSPFVESNRGSHGGSSDWSIPTFNHNNNNENEESFDSESFSFKTTRSSNSPSIDIRTCGVCAKLLTEKSSWGGQKIIANNELAVVAILICGHVYHAECLENMTSEINKYDPVCPVCTFGEKQTVRMSEKALKAEMEMKARVSKRSRSRVVDGEMMMDGDDVMFKSRSYKMSSSSSMRNNSVGKGAFLKRHFSFGSKGSRSMSENGFSRRKGFLWAKSNKE